MLEPDGPNHYDIFFATEHHHGSLTPGLQVENFHQSTENIVAINTQSTERSRIRVYFDGSSAEFESTPRSPIMTEHEHGLGSCGLRRIRQQPLSRVPAVPISETSSHNTSLTLPNSQASVPSRPSSPTLNFTEDLTRFPSESLHSFSFAHQSGEYIHNRQNVLKRSMEFMSQKFGWGSTNVGIVSAQARLNGDQEMQGMIELLEKAQLVGANSTSSHGQSYRTGPMTGPATAEETKNVFDISFVTSSRPSREGHIEIPDEGPLAETVLSEKEISSIDDMERESSTVPHLKIVTPFLTPKYHDRTSDESSKSEVRKPILRRTYTDTAPLSLQNKLIDALAQPYVAGEISEEHLLRRMVSTTPGTSGPHPLGSIVHGHSSRWTPAAQAIFTTESVAPFTILAANDLACLVFGLTQAEVRKIGILEVVREERREWLEERLCAPGQNLVPSEDNPKLCSETKCTNPSSYRAPNFLAGRGGVTAELLSKPNSRQLKNQASGSQGRSSGLTSKDNAKNGSKHHPGNKSRGVLLCGDVVPIQKRNGAIGSASLWVKEKRGGLIWVLEEIHENTAVIGLDNDANVSKITGSVESIWGAQTAQVGMDIGELLPQISRQGIDGKSGPIDYAEVMKRKYFTARNSCCMNIPCIVERVPDCTDLKISSYPHIAGIIVLSAQSLKITSSNSVFSAALFGQECPDGKSITEIIPEFDRILKILTDEDGVQLVDGIVIPEHSFRRAWNSMALRDGIRNATLGFSRSDGLPAKHRDGSEISIDAQLRVVKSDTQLSSIEYELVRAKEGDDVANNVTSTELVYALWITYSRHIHAFGSIFESSSSVNNRPQISLHQPSPGQTDFMNPMEMAPNNKATKNELHAPLSIIQVEDTLNKPDNKVPESNKLESESDSAEVDVSEPSEPVHKKTIDDFIILEEMGQGAYGQVKLARYKKNSNQKMVLKYVTKRRILVDTWTRDRRLGTVPLEIHVLDYLRQNGLQHPNIIEMADFFEDDNNYYIETVPHGLPGMDLFDYIELRENMEEAECRSIFVQVAQAIFHLHTKASVVHRDIKDENVVLDGEGKIKLIDFGSAAYIKNGPFDVFVGTIDYAAPEVLAGKPYRGKEQDVWALGILLYTIVYKENPFYSIDEIMDHDLRVPYVMNEDNINLIRAMLDRDVESRVTIEQVLDHPWCKLVDT
ncbi:hypothetical protein K3495_g7225 [Podosphaera aphanis]|nr:hypothetical protein K3495_g7225 [Podosphaera aphanis]